MPGMRDRQRKPDILAFDVLGTAAEWLGSVARAVDRLRLDVDAAEFARSWRAGYAPDQPGRVELDTLHR